MLPLYAPWFYWNLVGQIREGILSVFESGIKVELISKTYKSSTWGYEHYPVMNPPGTIKRITALLISLGVFDRVMEKILSRNESES